MRRTVLLALFALVAGCKGMGALGHVLGHVGRIAAVSSRALAPIARATVRALPTIANVAANVAVATADPVVVVEEGEEEPVEHPAPVGGPLLDDGDTCGYCPEDMACGSCGDVNSVACVLTPPGSYARCESQLKLH